MLAVFRFSKSKVIDDILPVLGPTRGREREGVRLLRPLVSGDECPVICEQACFVAFGDDQRGLLFL